MNTRANTRNAKAHGGMMAGKREFAGFDGGRPTKRRPPPGGRFRQSFASDSRDVAPNVDSGAKQDDGSVITINSSDSVPLISYNSAPAAECYERPDNGSDGVILVSDNDSVFSSVSAHGVVANNNESDDQFSRRGSDHETAITLISCGNVSVSTCSMVIKCASENTYYGDVDTDGDSKDDDDSVMWSSDDDARTYSDRENVRRYENGVPIDNSRNLFVSNWLQTYDFARSNDSADSVISCASDISWTGSSVNEHSASDCVSEADITSITDTDTPCASDISCTEHSAPYRISEADFKARIFNTYTKCDDDSELSSDAERVINDTVRCVSDMFSWHDHNESLTSDGSTTESYSSCNLGVLMSESSSDEKDRIEAARQDAVLNMAPRNPILDLMVQHADAIRDFFAGRVGLDRVGALFYPASPDSGIGDCDELSFDAGSNGESDGSEQSVESGIVLH